MMMYYVCDALMSRGWICQLVGGILWYVVLVLPERYYM